MRLPIPAIARLHPDCAPGQPRHGGPVLPDLSFARDGAQHWPAAIGADALDGIEDAVAGLLQHRAGVRLQGVEALRPILASSGPVGAVATSTLGPDCHPVRAILFDKTAAANWALPWHQDRTVAVQERVEVPGFGPWTVKDGMPHVAPPAAGLAGMVTLRVHLDPVPADNAPLLVAPGSHRLGRVAQADVPGAVTRCGSVACLAGAGDVWLYATLILHASDAAAVPRRRRVLQVDYAVGGLPGGLRWLGV